MPRTPRNPQEPTNETAQALRVKPLTETEAPKERSAGRPAKLVMPELPKMAMTEPEQALFDYFLAAFQQQYPDLTPTDLLLLHLAALEYVKYLRVVAEELETGKVISMARQHPGTNMRALLDQLSVTRKARTAGKKEEDPEAAELREFFMGMSAPKPKRSSSAPRPDHPHPID
jgi:hypothetical protein